MQLQELLDIRHCVFVMGPAGAAKSTCWKTLQEARNIMKPDMKVKVTDLNPKVLPTQDLYGYINLATREWKDGLLSNIMRALGQITDENPKWILLDGDLDANWIESMNRSHAHISFVDTKATCTHILSLTHTQRHGRQQNAHACLK